MAQLVDVSGIGRLEFPDDMSQSEIKSAIDKNFPIQKDATPSGNTFMDAVTAFNSGVENFTHGALQPLYESLGDSVKNASQRVAAKRQADYGQAAKNSPIAAPLANLAGNLVGTSPLMALGGAGEAALGKMAPQVLSKLATFAQNSPKLAQALNITGQGIAQGALMGAGQYVNPDDSRLANAALGATTGLLSYPIAKGLSAANPLVKAGTAGLLGGGISYFSGAGAPTSAAIGALSAITPFTLGKVLAKGVNALGGNMDVPENPLLYSAKQEAFQGVDPNQVAAKMDAARRLGIDITPAETGSIQAAQIQGAAGTSAQGAKNMQAGAANRAAQRTAAVSQLLSDIAPDNTNVAGDVRNVAQQIQQQREGALIGSQQSQISDFLKNLSPDAQDVSGYTRATAKQIIDNQKARLSNQVQPLYNEAYKQEVPQSQIDALKQQDGTIRLAIDQTLSDPHYQFDRQGYANNSIKILDLAKRRIDAQIAAAKGTPMKPGDDDLVRVLNESKKRLVEATDRFSPLYAQARSLYSDEAPAVQAIQNSDIGRIASLDDTQLQNVSKIIFDPNETNPKVLSNIRDQLSSKSPQLWQQLVRNEMERRLSNAPQVTGDLMFKKVLGNQRDFNQFMLALKGSPQLQRQFSGLRSQFSNTGDQLQALRGNTISSIANLDDTQLKNVSRIIFDPAQTDMSVLRKTKAQIQAANPELWQRIFRNEIERRTGGAGDYSGSQIYKQVLKKPNDFAQFMTAAEGMPSVQQKLSDMRLLFKDTLEPSTVKTTAQRAANKMTDYRDALISAKNFALNLLGGHYDKAITEIINNPNWDKEFYKVSKAPTKQARVLKFQDLMARMPISMMTQTNNPQSNAAQQ